MFLNILFWLFIASLAIQCIYALYFFLRFFTLQEQSKPKQAQKPVSIIICAKNESRNLQQYLPSILAQRYTNESGISLFEVIVVNDASTDDTATILEQIQEQHPELKIVTIPETEERALPGKKYALNKGVAAARYDWFLFTDADCEPVGKDWLAKMVSPLYDDKQIVAGYGQFRSEQGLLNAFIRWETMHTFLQYSTYALAGKPYMAVGRNLACTRSIWQQAGRASVWGKLPSGDDDLLMQIMANGDNTTIVADPEAFTVTEGKKNWKEWMKQKQRHMSTGKYYKNDIKALLATYASSHAAMWLLFIVLLIADPCKAVIMMMGIRCIVYWLLWGGAATRLEEKNLFYLFPLFDLGWMFYNFIFSPYIIWKNKQQWT